MPDSVRHPEGLEKIGFRPEFIPMKNGAGMTKRNNPFLIVSPAKAGVQFKVFK